MTQHICDIDRTEPAVVRAEITLRPMPREGDAVRRREPQIVRDLCETHAAQLAELLGDTVALTPYLPSLEEPEPDPQLEAEEPAE